MLLQVRGLRTHFVAPGGVAYAVNGVDLDVPAGRTVALVGESGCGKSATALSLVRLVPPPGRIIAGSAHFERRDLLRLPERELRRVRGARIGLVFQEPMSSLNPVLPIGHQVAEVLQIHRRLSRRAAWRQAEHLLQTVGIPAPDRRLRAYAHELSGGMQQRALIAVALACEPALLIADEPTTALDVTLQAQILRLLADLQARSGMSILFITHDLNVVAAIADAVYVMYAGTIVEHGPVERIFGAPRHPYTQALLRSRPRLNLSESVARQQPLPVIPGEIPDPRDLPPGCPFQPRCELGRQDARCRTDRPRLEGVQPGHARACWLS